MVGGGDCRFICAEVYVVRQRVGGYADGSWNPVSKWAMVGGRVYSTAINCLTLEVYCRYTREE